MALAGDRGLTFSQGADGAPRSRGSSAFAEDDTWKGEGDTLEAEDDTLKKCRRACHAIRQEALAQIRKSPTSPA